MSDLIGRIEAASEGSRELDRLIATQIGWTRVPPAQSQRSHGHWLEPGVMEHFNEKTLWRDPPAYTTSIDAALTLVPEGLYPLITFGQGWREPRISIPNRSGVTLRAIQGLSIAEAEAATPALAICATALRARMAG